MASRRRTDDAAVQVRTGVRHGDAARRLRDERFDVAIGAITITPEREKLVDFSYPTHRSGVAVAIRKQSGPLFALGAYFTALVELAPLVALILLLLVATGVAMWWIERRQRGGQDTHVTTLRDGVYWAVVTMTTVGYGDKTPKSTGGRIVAIGWMFASLVLISLLSANLVSKLTADRVEGATPPFRSICHARRSRRPSARRAPSTCKRNTFTSRRRRRSMKRCSVSRLVGQRR